MGEKSMVRVDRNNLATKLGQKFAIPVIRITAVEVVRLLVKSRSKWRCKKKPPAGLGDADHFLKRFDRARDMFQHFGTQDHIEAGVGNRNTRDVRNVVNMRVLPFPPL